MVCPSGWCVPTPLGVTLGARPSRTTGRRPWRQPSPPCRPAPDPPAPTPGRSVLRGLGIGGATAVVAGTALLSYRVYDSAVLDPGSGPAHDPWRRWQDTPGPLGAIAAAVLAASPHNTQPWAFAVADGRDRRLRRPDARQRARSTRYSREQLHRAGLRPGEPRARLRADGPAARAHPAAGRARRRARGARRAVRRCPRPRIPCTRRSASGTPTGAPTSRSRCRPEVLAGLSAAERDRATWRCSWIVEPGPRAALGGLLVDAAEALVADEQQSVDSFAWFRPDNDAEQRHRDGLVLDGQGLSPLILGVAKLLPPSSRTGGRPVLGRHRPVTCTPRPPRPTG